MILAVRHGERGDRSTNEAEKKKLKLYYDPHLTDVGAEQAQMTGKEIQSRINAYEEELKTKGLHPGKKIKPVLLVSPFLRTIQTAFNIAKNLDGIYENTIFLQNEICELLWDQQEFDLDPLPVLFSKTQKLEDFKEYGVDFINSGISLKPSFISHPDFIQPKYPELREECVKRIGTFLDIVPKVFFQKFKSNEYVLVWVAHQYGLAAAVWNYIKDLNPINFPDPMIQYCGIVDCRYEEPETKPEKYKVLQLGSNPHVKI